jgi:hypothetical protein
MSDFLDESFQPAPAKRPVFLTVLCILSFVGCGLYFFSAVYGILTAETQRQTYRMMNTMGDEQAIPGFVTEMYQAMEKNHGWILLGQYLSLVNVLLCLLGVILMWRLRKTGFYVYAFAQLIPFVTLFMMISSFSDVPMLGAITIVTSSINVVLAAAFVIMYGVNLKHMR